MQVSGKLHAPAALRPGKSPRYPSDMMSTGAGLNAVEKRKICLCRFHVNRIENKFHVIGFSVTYTKMSWSAVAMWLLAPCRHIWVQCWARKSAVVIEAFRGFTSFKSILNGSLKYSGRFPLLSFQ
jgi:hypothetical protein